MFEIVVTPRDSEGHKFRLLLDDFGSGRDAQANAGKVYAHLCEDPQWSVELFKDGVLCDDVSAVVYGMTSGKMYRVLHREPSHQRTKSSIMRYVGEDSGNLVFTARPVSGVRTVPRVWIQQIRPVDDGAEVYVNRIL